MRFEKISTVAFIVLLLAALGLFKLHALVAVGPVAIAVQVAGIALMLWARITFGRRSFHFAADPTKGGLVRHGPYRFTRNPIYTAALAVIAAGIATHLSVPSLALGVVVVGGMLVRIFCEERLLAAEYPEYGDYRAKTRRLIPFVL